MTLSWMCRILMMKSLPFQDYHLLSIKSQTFHSYLSSLSSLSFQILQTSCLVGYFCEADFDYFDTLILCLNCSNCSLTPLYWDKKTIAVMSFCSKAGWWATTSWSRVIPLTLPFWQVLYPQLNPSSLTLLQYCYALCLEHWSKWFDLSAFDG